MKNRLLARIQKVTRSRSKLFCAFLTLGYPSLDATGRLIEAFEKEGVDIIELGFPFSDPLADGPTIQFSSERALAKGVHSEDVFRIVKELRRKGSRIPILFFSYLNPILHYGFKKFLRRAKSSGFDGLIIPDLPPEEEPALQKECQRLGLTLSFLIAPTTEKKRAGVIARASRGFIYYVSVRGVTGARQSLPEDIKKHLSALRRVSDKPFLVGFGVSTPEQAKALSRISQGVIVGSALIDHLRRSGGKIDSTVQFVREMIRSVKGKNAGTARA